MILEQQPTFRWYMSVQRPCLESFFLKFLDQQSLTAFLQCFPYLLTQDEMSPKWTCLLHVVVLYSVCIQFSSDTMDDSDYAFNE